MKNFVNVNLMTHSKDAASQLESHNKNRENIDYLLDEQDRLENYHESFNIIEDVIQICNVSAGTYEENLKNFYASYKKGSPLQYNLDYLEKIRNQQLKDKGKKSHQTKHVMELVVSLSNEMTEHCLKQGLDINAGFKQYVKDLKKLNIIACQIDIHYDEGFYSEKDGVKTPNRNYHMHILAYNYDFTTQKAIASNFKKRDYRNLQTLAQNSFQKVGLDYKRGVSKLITNKKHLKRNDYIQHKKTSELKKLFVELDATKKDLKAKYTLINAQKNTLKELREKLDKQSNLYKLLTSNIKILQQQEKDKRAEHRELDSKVKQLKSDMQAEELKVDDYQKWFDEMKLGVKEFIQLHTNKVDKKYQIKSISEFYNELVELINYVSNFDLKLEELEKINSVNAVLREKIEVQGKQNTQLHKQLEKLAKYESKIANLIDMKNTLDDENYDLKQYIKQKDLEEDYNFFITNIKKRELNSRDI